ncbi:Abi family protein [Sphingobacterium kitahiroshimense]|uniref:Abi family protein n=1 Tax=Sphingobacterium kitahiroshimense TaxID=470446 RepID=UPI00320987CA
MPRVPYAKPAITYPAQLQKLLDRGLNITNPDKALFLLQNISYYRLSGYWYPLLKYPKSEHNFKADSTFDKAFNMYCFDRELRKLVSAELEKIEVAIRAKMIYILSHDNDSFWYRKADLFSDIATHNTSIKKLTEEFKRSDEQFLVTFKKKYNNDLPPSWMLLEVSSIGGLSHFYKNLKPSRSKRDIANYFGLDYKTFESWLHSIVYVRNVCAHHSRLWNRVMRITPIMPTSPKNKWLTTTDIKNSMTGKSSPVNNRTYYLLSMMIYLLEIINPRHSFKDKFIDLLIKYPNIDPSAMGFPPTWMEEPLWQ